MTAKMNVKKMSSFASALVAVLTRILPIQRVLTFSLADDLIAPQKNLLVSMDKGASL